MLPLILNTDWLQKGTVPSLRSPRGNPTASEAQQGPPISPSPNHPVSSSAERSNATNEDENRLKTLYTRLKQNQSVKGLPQNFETFQKGIQNEDTRKAFHNRLLQNKKIKGIPSDYNKFTSALSPSSSQERGQGGEVNTYNPFREYGPDNAKPFHTQPRTQDETEQGIFEILGNAWQRGWNIGEQANILNIGSDPDEDAIQQITAIQKENQTLKPSNAYKEFNQSKTFGEALSRLVEDPLTIIPEITLESLSALVKHGMGRVPASAATGAGVGSVLPGGGTAAGAGLGAITGLGLTSLNLEYSGSILESFQESGADLQDPESLKNFFNNEDKLKEARSTALKKGIPIALFDMVSAGIAGRIGSAPAKSALRKLGRETGELGIQSGLGGAGELSGQVISGQEISAPAILAEMVGETGTSVPEIAIGHIVHKKKTGQQVTPDDYKNIEDVDKGIQEINKSAEIGEITQEEATQIKQDLQEATTTTQPKPKVESPDSVSDAQIETPQQEGSASEAQQGPPSKGAVGDDLSSREETDSDLSESEVGPRGAEQETQTETPTSVRAQRSEVENNQQPATSFQNPDPTQVLEGNYTLSFRESEQANRHREPVLVNTRTGKPVGRSSSNYVPALAEYLTRLDDSGKRVDNKILNESPSPRGEGRGEVSSPFAASRTVGEGGESNVVAQGDDPLSLPSETEYINRVNQESESPTEILEAIEIQEQLVSNEQSGITNDGLSEVLWNEGHTISMKDLEQFGDPAMIEGDEGRFYRLNMQKEGTENTDLANLTDMANERLNADYTESDILEHWFQFQDAKRSGEDSTLRSLKTKFEQITGEPYSRRLSNEVARLEAMRQENATDQEAKVAESILYNAEDALFDTDGNLVESEFVQKINELRESDPELADYLNQQPDEQSVQQEQQRASQSQLSDLSRSEAESSSSSNQTTQTTPDNQSPPQPEVNQQTPSPRGEGRGEVSSPFEGGERSEASQGDDPQDSGLKTQDSSFRIQSRERYESLKRQFNREIGGQLSSGLNPKLLKMATQLGIYQIEQGAKKFSDFVKVMTNELGDKIRPFLAQVYENARQSPEIQNSDIAQELTPRTEVRDFERRNKTDMNARLETEETDKSDYIKRRLQDVRDNEEVNKSLESIGDYNVQNVESANNEADALIKDFQEEFGEKQGLLEVFQLLQNEQLPDLMVGPTADKLALRMQKLGMSSDAVNVLNWLQEKARGSARVMRSLRSDASPESTVSRAFAGLEESKQKALEQEFKDGKTYNEVLEEIKATLRDWKAQGTEAMEQSRNEMVQSISKMLSKENESTADRTARREAAEDIVDGFMSEVSEEQLSDYLSELADFDTLSQEEKDTLIDYATEMSDLLADGKLELAKSKWDELMKYMQNISLTKRGSHELILDLWYTGVLSGLTTIERSHKGSTLTAASHTITMLMANPKVAPLAITQMIKGFRGSWKTYLHIIKTGKTDVQFGDFKPKQPRYTDKLLNSQFKDLNTWNKIMKGFWEMPGRAYRTILAWDQVLKQGLSEGYQAVYEYDRALDSNKNHQKAIREAKKQLAIEKENEAKEQADYEIQRMEEDGENIPTGYRERRVREIVRSNQRQEFVKRSLEESARAALVSHPVGTLGQMFRYIDQAISVNEGDAIPVQLTKYMGKFLFPFIRVGINYTNVGLDYTPYGFVRAAKKNIWTKDGVRPLDNFEKRSYFARASIGVSMFMGTLASLFDWDEEEGFKLKPEEDRWLDVVGSATGNWWEHYDITEDFKPWSVRVRNPFTNEWSKWFSYIDNPIGFAIAPLAIMSDEVRFKEFNAEASGRERPQEVRGFQHLIGSGLLGVFRYSMDQSFNQGMNAIGRLMDSNNQETFSRNVYRAFGRPVEGFYPNLYKQLYGQYKAVMDIPEKDANRWYERIARSVPFADAIITNQAYDVFGYPIIKEFDVPMIPDVVLKMAKDNVNYRSDLPEWQLLHKYEQVTVGGFLPPQVYDGERLTPEQQNEYALEAGLQFRQKINRRINRLQQMEAIELQKELNKLKYDAAADAKKRIFEGRGRRLSPERPDVPNLGEQNE